MSFDESYPIIKITQPLGDYYVARIDYKDILEISHVHRREKVDDLDRYMGIQRRLDAKRVESIGKYVTNLDACFPTSIIMAVSSENCELSKDERSIRLFEKDPGKVREIGLILDGQHRLEGLRKEHPDGSFELAVAIFVGADIATQAMVFATVNLAQTKVNRSLVYDLLAMDNVRSPLKSCHEITVALDTLKGSPFFKRIKRLGVRTPDRAPGEEVLTQAAFVEALVPFISKDPNEDRNSFLRLLQIRKPSNDELHETPFRQLWIDKKEKEIAQIVLNYFSAVKFRWRLSWDELDRKGNVLPKTNGLKALMRFLKPVYLDINRSKNFSLVPSVDDFKEYLLKVELEDEEFDITTFPPGSSGEAKLFGFLEESLSSKQVPFDSL
jgi:DGQHR domain-containing protein